MPGKLIKTAYRTDNPRLAPVAAGLNELGTWVNVFGSTKPIVTHPVPGGVKLHWLPWESPMAHPWRVWQPDTTVAKVDVDGGKVNTGVALVTVTGLADRTVADGLRVWLSVKHYYNTATASEYALASGTSAFPTSTHSSASQTTILPVAEIDGTTLYQYLYEDQFVPRLNPPLPNLTNTYALLTVAGTLQWKLVGPCS
jgi:hypothetical protein